MLSPKSNLRTIDALSHGVALLLAMFATSSIHAAPTRTPWPSPGAPGPTAVAASPFGAVRAIADATADTIAITTNRGDSLTTIPRTSLQALLPWMTLDASFDGPSALAFTATARQLFILVHDDTTAPDSQPSDAVLRYDIPTQSLTLFARLEASNQTATPSLLAALHHRGILYLATDAGISCHLATSNQSTGPVLATWSLPSAGTVRALALDRDTSTLFAATSTQIWRTILTNNFSSPPLWTPVCTTQDLRALAFSDTFGAAQHQGLYLLTGTAPGSQVLFIPTAVAFTATNATPTLYDASTTSTWLDLAPAGDGSLLLASSSGAQFLRESSETLLPFDAWLADELAQHITLAKGLISPDGEPAGWVIDADVTPGATRFHPATPDAAAWAVLLLIASDKVRSDATAQPLIRTILTRYAGLAQDTIAPSRTSDGIFRHWINPTTGSVKPGWDPEFATLSTMKIVLAASRAVDAYPDDPEIARAASRIIFRVKNWDSYLRVSDRALYLKGTQAAPDLTTGSRPFFEGIHFVEQAARYGGANSVAAFTFWLNRATLPSATYLAGFPISSTATNRLESAFISIYPALAQRAYRQDPTWRNQLTAIRWSNAAWTDDSAPRFSTVFSAGTTRSDWGGYNADSLTNRPGNVTTFTSLIGLSAFADPEPTMQAYHAYRKGARQTFKTGAQVLYRRSDIDRAYLPNSAGLPDTALAGLALAELLQPGFLDAHIATPYIAGELEPTDRNADTRITLDDLYSQSRTPLDLNADATTNRADTTALANWLRRHEREHVQAR